MEKWIIVAEAILSAAASAADGVGGRGCRWIKRIYRP